MGVLMEKSRIADWSGRVVREVLVLDNLGASDGLQVTPLLSGGRSCFANKVLLRECSDMTETLDLRHLKQSQILAVTDPTGKPWD